MFETGQNWKIAALRISECVHYFFIICLEKANICSFGELSMNFMNVAISEAKKSYKIGDVPVGAVIVKNGVIIAKAHNMKEKKHNAIMHAEIIAIERACKKLKRWRLDDCELYVTMEPCIMCTGAILQSRIKKIYYSIDNDEFGMLKIISQEKKYRLNVNKGMYGLESLEMLKSFFSEKRKK